jgi:hypothetical protein
MVTGRDSKGGGGTFSAGSSAWLRVTAFPLAWGEVVVVFQCMWCRHRAATIATPYKTTAHPLRPLQEMAWLTTFGDAARE